MKRDKLNIITYIMSVICLALFIAGGAMLTAGLPSAHEHVGVHISATEATCEYAGNVEYWLCKSCGKYFADELLTEEITQADAVIAQLPHTEEVIEGTPATCTSTGLSDGKRCTVCKTVTVERQVIAKLPHTEETIKGKPATCTATGLTDGKRCTVCTTVTVQQQVTDTIPHTEETIKGTPATCTSTGLSDGKRCNVCKTVTVQQQVTNPIPHTEETIQGTPATCTATGISDGKRCTVCTTVTVEQQVTDALGHDPDLIEETQSTCFVQGNPDYYHCARCEGNFAEEQCTTALTEEQLLYPLADHTYKQCFNNTRHYKAATCGHELEEIDGGDHNFTNSICDDCGFYRCGVTYTLNSDGTAYKVTDRITYYGTEVVVYPEYDGLPVTEIAKDAFATDNMTSISIPASVTQISENAFSYCYKLETITVDEDNPVYESKGNCLIDKDTRTLVVGCKNSVIPNDSSVISIGNRAFYRCTYLTEITIPYSVTHIGTYAFYGCSSLESVTLSERVATISSHAFDGCTSLAQITLPASVKTINAYAFYDCKGLTAINIPDGVTVISGDAFGNCTGLTEITIPSGVTQIISYAFEKCSNLAEVNFSAPSKLESIGYRAFGGCSSLKNIRIPADVNYITAGAFENCSGLEHITVSINNTRYKAAGDCLIDKLNNSLVAGCKNSIIPDNGSVTQIAQYAFSGCSQLTSLHIPASVSYISDNAFSRLTALAEITVDENNAAYSGSGNCLIDKSNKRLILACNNSVIPNDGSVTEIGAYVFNGSLELTDITIPSCMTFIDYAAFDQSDIKNVYIEDLESFLKIKLGNSNGAWHSYPLQVGGNFYLNGELLTELTIPDGITELDTCIFYNCLSLTKVVIPDHVTKVYYSFLDGCENVTELIIGDGLTEMISARNIKELKTVVVGSGVTEIGSSAFLRCDNLESVTFRGNITEIGSNAFYGCTSLTEIAIPDSVQTIGNYAFGGCTSLTEIVLPDSVQTIGNSAFANCKNFTKIVIPDNVQTLGTAVFNSCTSLTEIVLPDNLQSLDRYTFRNCTALTEIVLPDSVQTLGDRLFYGCTNLTTVTIGGNVEQIPYYAFYKCTSLTDIYYDGTKEQWLAIAASDWDYNAGDYTIHFNDGTTMQKGEE